ncbi:MAG: YigZ family protein [Clostridia bacterium]|nr:YigZ family protein [Clostridia bacterium]
MDKTYITVKQEATAEITEKKSRFIASMCHVETEEEAAAFIASVKKQHYSARHNVYAFILNNGFKKYSDDGEPTRTGGFPVLEMLENEGITDCVCVVTRYFGGTLLGTGGLIRAYTKAAKDCLAECGLLKKTMCDILEIKCDYTFLSKVEHILKTGDFKIENIDYGESVTVKVICEKTKTDALSEEITDTFGINVSLQIVDEIYYTL